MNPLLRLGSFALTIRGAVEIASKTIERCRTGAFRRHHIDCEFRLLMIEYAEEFGASIVVKTMQFEVLKIEIEIPAVYYRAKQISMPQAKK